MMAIDAAADAAGAAACRWVGKEIINRREWRLERRQENSNYVRNVDRAGHGRLKLNLNGKSAAEFVRIIVNWIVSTG